MAIGRLITVVELPSFIRDAESALDEDEREKLKAYLAANPEAGVVIQGTGGVRKLRWSLPGKGKRGGGRVIYYFHNDTIPVYLFKFYTKAAKSDLSTDEGKELSRIVRSIVDEHRKRK